ANAHTEHGAFRQRRVDDAIAELLQEWFEQKERVAILAPDVFSVDEDTRIGVQRIADAHRDRLEKSPALRIERRASIDLGQGRQGTLSGFVVSRLEHFYVRTGRLVREHTDTGAARLRPRSLDDRLRFAGNESFSLGPQAIQFACSDDPLGFQASGI